MAGTYFLIKAIIWRDHPWKRPTESLNMPLSYIRTYYVVRLFLSCYFQRMWFYSSQYCQMLVNSVIYTGTYLVQQSEYFCYTVLNCWYISCKTSMLLKSNTCCLLRIECSKTDLVLKAKCTPIWHMWPLRAKATRWVGVIFSGSVQSAKALMPKIAHFR